MPPTFGGYLEHSENPGPAGVSCFWDFRTESKQPGVCRYGRRYRREVPAAVLVDTAIIMTPGDGIRRAETLCLRGFRLERSGIGRDGIGGRIPPVAGLVTFLESHAQRGIQRS